MKTRESEMIQTHVETSHSDEALIERVRAGDDTAFAVIVDRYTASFFRTARKIVASECDAHDVVQTSFMSIYFKLDQFQPHSSFKRWAYRIVVNTALLTLRRRRTRSEVGLGDVLPVLADDHVDALALSPTRMRRPDEMLARRRLNDRLEDAIGALPTEYYEVFSRREFHGQSMGQISLDLGLSVSAVKSRLHRARKQLRRELVGSAA